MALSFIVGMPNGRNPLPLLFAMYTRRKGRERYPRCLKECTADAFFVEVFQITWSTPGVLLPWFSVTRLTAITLPLNEWVNSRCKACTLPHLFPCTAF